MNKNKSNILQLYLNKIGCMNRNIKLVTVVKGDLKGPLSNSYNT